MLTHVKVLARTSLRFARLDRVFFRMTHCCGPYLLVLLSSFGMNSLDDRTPKHEQLRRRLLEVIGGLEPGTRLPAERELSARFEVSRDTLRRTLDDLEGDGYVARRRGAGTFVSRPQITKRFHLVSFSEEMRQRGLVPSSRVIASRTGSAGAAAGAKLKISPADQTFQVRRLRLADGEPMALEDLTVPLALVPGLRAEELEGAQSFYSLLADRYDIVVAQASQTIEPTVLEQAEAELLEVAEFSPALRVQRVTATADARPVEYVTSLYRGDRYRFEINLTARRSDGRGT
jgi:GntR family transcriptional regulator